MCRLEKKRVLINCAAGVSRSPTITIAYLVKYSNMTLKQAFQHVSAIRPIIRPNNSFWKQLIRFEKHVTGKSTVVMKKKSSGIFAKEEKEKKRKKKKKERKKERKKYIKKVANFPVFFWMRISKEN